MQPLGLDCPYGFPTEIVAIHINRELGISDNKPSSEFVSHLDHCRICLSRILLLIQIRNLLLDCLEAKDGNHGLYIKLYEWATEKYSSLPEELSRRWRARRFEHFGEITNLWLEGSEIHLATICPGESSFSSVLVEFTPGRISPCREKLALFYPDFPTVLLCNLARHLLSS